MVATALPSLEPYEGLIRLVRPGQGFGEQLEAALAEDNADLRKQRKDLAEVNSWKTKYREIRTLVEETIAKKGARS